MNSVFEKGVAEGKTYSIIRFLDIHGHNLDEALEFLEQKDIKKVRAHSRAIVENAKIWRKIQRIFNDLLNGLIDDLEKALSAEDVEKIEISLRALNAAFPNKRLAILTEFEKSKI